MQRIEFRDVTDLLSKAYSRGMIAAYMGVGIRAYESYRAQPGQRHYRRPPADWRDRLRPLALAAVEYYRQHAQTVEAELLENT